MLSRNIPDDSVERRMFYLIIFMTYFNYANDRLKGGIFDMPLSR